MRIDRASGAGSPFDYPEAIGFNRAPFTSLPCGSWASVAGPQGAAIGCFGWFDPDSGEVSNCALIDSSGNPITDSSGGTVSASINPGLLLGFVLPHADPYNLWERVFVRYPQNGVPPFPQQIVRPGVRCLLASQGVFRPQFPYGGEIGMQVFADPATGLPYAGNITGGYVATPYTLMQAGGANARLRMSSFVQPLSS